GLLEEAHRPQADRWLVDQHAAEPVPERRFHGDLEQLGGAHDVGDDAVDRTADVAGDPVAVLHHRARAALKALVALLDLLERRQPRVPAMKLGAQRLDLGLAAMDLVGQELLARGKPVGLAAEIEPGLAQLLERAVDPTTFALELLGALALLLGLA